ncbi:MAG: bacillithiol biosynthesis cysteine-adding enzyme BshC [Deltaproteobacteria bacterium]|nr:bacillithiol biosynthesis cysteine-adding enzyme BshC [Deltaproteobacteria bacterium]
MARSFTPAWLDADPVAVALLERGFADRQARARAAERARDRVIDPRLVTAWAAQEARRPTSAARRASLAAVAEGAPVIVTGQQAGLFLGPLYTLHKAATAVVDARALAAELGRPVVPVFWLQTEDHDVAEIRSVGLPGADAPQLIALDDALGPAVERVSIAHRALGPRVGDALAELRTHLQGPHAGEVIELLARHYRPEATWGEAMGATIAELFADHGLLVLDPRDPALGPLARPVHGRAIARARDVADALETRARAIVEAGFEVQIKPRELALSCHHVGGPEGPRQRVPLDRGDLLAELEVAPERFSTTALLRPILQDSWLPTVGYVGGPGELAYFAELPPLYAFFDLPMPLAIPRARFRLATPAARRLAEQLGLSTTDAARPLDELARAADPAADPTLPIAGAFDVALDAALARLGELAEAARDHGFARAAPKSAEHIRHAFHRLVERVRHARQEADHVTHERLLRFRGLLAPRGEPQERTLGFMAFAAQVGPRALVDRIVSAVVPFDGALREIDL